MREMRIEYRILGEETEEQLGHLRITRRKILK
jgi:hypothetical protein